MSIIQLSVDYNENERWLKDLISAIQSNVSDLTVTFQFIAWQIFIVCRNNSPLCRTFNVNAWIFNTVCGHSEVLLVDVEHQIAHNGIFLVRNWFLKWNKLIIQEYLWFLRRVKWYIKYKIFHKLCKSDEKLYSIIFNRRIKSRRRPLDQIFDKRATNTKEKIILQN